MATPTIPLPEPGEQTPESFLQMSRRALQQSRLHLAEDYRLQASEKVSGAVSAATKGVAELRNWRHDSHALRTSIVSQLGAELGRSTAAAQALYRGRAVANEQHQNFYDNVLLADDILRDIQLAESFVDTIERLMRESPKPFTVARPQDAHRVNQLTGYAPEVGATDALGFANFDGVVREG